MNGTSKRIFSDVDTIMIVGHNPAIERLLNKLLLSSSNDQVKEWQHYLLSWTLLCYEIPTLERGVTGRILVRRDAWYASVAFPGVITTIEWKVLRILLQTQD